MKQQTVFPLKRPQNLDISNWREHPLSQWSFQNVRQLIPTAPIRRSSRPLPFEVALYDFENLVVDSPTGSAKLDQLLNESFTDSLLVLHRQQVVMEWNAPNAVPGNPHIVFSISKSITAMLAGILESRGVIDSDAPIVKYLPGVRDCVYADCTVRHLLDMTVALNFEENYTDKNSEYVRYRKATSWNPVNQNETDQGLESFLYSLSKSEDQHGHAFLYRSPNSDLLGLLLERAAGEPLSVLLSKNLWQPMGSISGGYITVDRFGVARGAGGICLGIHDLARLGLLFLNNGEAGGEQVIPPQWIADTCNNGDQAAWDRGNYQQKLPNYRYRNKWYLDNGPDEVICARGIHGQLLYINPARSVVIAKTSSHPDPLNDATTAAVMAAFENIARECQ